MSWIVEPLELAPDAFALARRLANRPGVVMARAEGGAVTFLASDPVARSSAFDPEPSLELEPCVGGDVPRWFGLLPYDALRAHAREPMSGDSRPRGHVSEPLWLRYDAVIRVGRDVSVLGETREAVRALVQRLEHRQEASTVGLSFSAPLEPEVLHEARIRRALEHIGAGDIYEVNLARRFELELEGAPWDALAELETAGSMPEAFALGVDDLRVVAASPEQCLLLRGDRFVSTSPIKGTRPRHAEPAEDRRLAEELERDPKERAELTMIIDVERNDLGRIAEAGSVRILEAPRVVALPGVHHRIATVAAQVLASASRAAVMAALLPSGSVTGAPKRRAMQLIAELEPCQRGLYTGVVGFLRRDGGLDLKMAIRTLTARGPAAHYYTGGGIVADSVPEREVEETLWKAERVVALSRSGRTRKLGLLGATR
jgi:anthranilate/para-aminobenzoate synthase component I